MKFASLIENKHLITPNRLVEPHSWIGHIPFLQWVISELKPKKYVELGVHTGNSFCAAAECLKKLEIKSKAYGVDTWKGDHQASFYGEEVYTDLVEYINNNELKNTVLIRKYFDEAVEEFENDSIDLLHIDGLHTYEAVKNDYTKWLPKMSNIGVILFHDIKEKNGDFGVWKLWDEISTIFPSFEFDHNHGLGVLLVGEKVPDRLLDISKLKIDEKNLVKKIFSMHGDNIKQLAMIKIIHNKNQELIIKDKELFYLLNESKNKRNTSLKNCIGKRIKNYLGFLKL